MANKRDYYEVLGVSKDSSQDDIKKAFRKLSRQWHPDMQHDKSDAEKKIAEEKFKEIAEAYEVLSDDSKRKQYDQFGFNGPQGFGEQGVDLGEFFRRHSGIFEDLFSGGNPFRNFANGFSDFGFSTNVHHSYKDNLDIPQNGRNVRVAMNISLKECIFGTIREFDLPINKTCPDCNGSGHDANSKIEECPVCHGTGMVTEVTRNGFMISQVSHPCEKCFGRGMLNLSPCKKCQSTGRITEKEHFSQKIDPGTMSGKVIVINGKGEGGRNGGRNGNLEIVVNVQNSDNFFSLKNSSSLDLQSVSWISPLTTLFGGKISVLTPYGSKEITVSAGISNGTVVKVEKCGIKTKTKVGDLYVTLMFDNLAYLSDNDVKKLKEVHEHVGLSNLKRQNELIKRFSSWQ